jgi:hypothetical protein
MASLGLGCKTGLGEHGSKGKSVFTVRAPLTYKGELLPGLC